MSDSVSWLVDLTIKDGQIDNFKSLVKEMVDATQSNEPDALNYEWFISADGKSGQIYERYADSAATMTHLGAFGAKFAERFLAAVEPTSFIVYGKPNDEVKEALSGFSPAYMEALGGFAR